MPTTGSALWQDSACAIDRLRGAWARFPQRRSPKGIADATDAVSLHAARAEAPSVSCEGIAGSCAMM